MMYEKGIIDAATALKELKQSSNETGIYTNIDEKNIKEAEMQPPPQYSPEINEPEPINRKSGMDRIKEFFRV